MDLPWHGPAVNHNHQVQNIPRNGSMSALVFSANSILRLKVVIPTFLFRGYNLQIQSKSYIKEDANRTL